MADKRGISGLALTFAAAGGFLLYAGIKDVPILDGLRELAGGRLPAGRPPAPFAVDFTAPRQGFGPADPGAGVPDGGSPPGGSSGLESRIVTAARKYIGINYVWAAHDPSVGFDCSGYVTWVLHRDVGIDLSKWSACNNVHTVTGQFLITNGCQTVPRAQAQSGDLVCWPGHIGIALDKDRMLNAPHSGAKVREDKIWGAPIFRRVVRF